MEKTPSSYREVVLLRVGSIHVYVLEEYGRLLLRRLVYASDAAATLHVPSPVRQCRLPGRQHLLECGEPTEAAQVRLLLVASDCFWSLLIASGRFWLLLIASGCFWSLLIAFGRF